MLIYFVHKSIISKDLLIRGSLKKLKNLKHNSDELKTHYSKEDINSNNIFDKTSLNTLNDTSITFEENKSGDVIFLDKNAENVSKNDLIFSKKTSGKIYNFDNNFIKEIFNENENSELDKDLISSLIKVFCKIISASQHRTSI